MQPDARPRQDVGLIWVSARDGKRVYKYRNLDGERWGFEVFDARTDPEERRNLFDEADTTHRAMARELRGYKQRLVNAYPRSRGKRGRSVHRAEEEEALRSLGYIQ